MVAKVVKEKLEKDGQGVFYKSLHLAGLDAKPRRSVDWAFEDKGRLYVTIWDITTYEKNGVEINNSVIEKLGVIESDFPG